MGVQGVDGAGGAPDPKFPPIVQKALAISNEATKVDNAAKSIQNLDERYEAYHKASNLYGDAVRQILLCKSRQLPDALMKRLRASGYEYMDRAEELKKKLVEVGYLNTNGEVKKAGASAMSNGGNRSNDQDPNGTGSSKSAAEPLDESDGLIEKPNVLWTDIAGLEAAKQSLSEAVIMPRRFPQLYYGRRQAWKGILLYGPPGTGKSYLAKAVATEVNSTFISLSASDIVSKWMGDSEKNIRKKFEAARAHQPAVIFFDEIDALCGPRGEGESEASRRIKTELLIQMDGVGKDTTGILVLAATNIPWQLDTAIRRRFQKRVHIGLPDAPARARMFQLELQKNKHRLTKEDFKTLGEMSAGRSGSDIKALVGQALAYPIRRIDEAMHFKKVSLDHFPSSRLPPILP